MPPPPARRGTGRIRPPPAGAPGSPPAAARPPGAWRTAVCRVRSAPLLDQVGIRDVANLLRWDAHDHGAGGDVGDDHGPGRHERLLADLDTGAQDRAAPDPAGTTKPGPRHWRVNWVASHGVVVGRDNAWADEDVVLDLGVGRDVAVRLNPNPL